MSSLDEDVIEEALHRGESMLVEEFVGLVERPHDEQAGVPYETLTEYAREIASRRDARFDVEEIMQVIDDRLTDSDSWAERDAFYALDDDRISRYPSRWHDHLGGSLDVASYLRYLQDEAREYSDDAPLSGAGDGISQDRLIDIVATVGRADRDAARAALEDGRDSGELVEDADQHPRADVYLRDRAEELRDGTLDG